jgi:putative redox protein
MHTVETNWIDGLAFTTTIGDHSINMDAKPEVGGRNLGPNPKRLLLSALTGCTGMDVVSLFKKMRQEVEDFSINASAELTEEHPIHYKRIHLKYKVTGTNLDENKVKRAVELSMERYCGISHMLGKATELDYSVEIEELATVE